MRLYGIILAVVGCFAICLGAYKFATNYRRGKGRLERKIKKKRRWKYERT